MAQLPEFLLKTLLVAGVAVTMAKASDGGRAIDPVGGDGCVSHLDYVVFASIADSSEWVGLSTYRSEQPATWQAATAPQVQHIASVAWATSCGSAPPRAEPQKS